MFKKPTKKQFLIRRILLSVVATFSVIIIATVTVLFMLGYRLDSGNGRLEQGALLQFDSKPNGADVYVDGYSIGSRTATKHTVVAGEHTVKMTKYGYQDWSRTVTLSAGTLTWLDYTRFVPTERPVTTITTHKTLVAAKTSGDGKWALLQEAANTPTFQLADLRSAEVKLATLTIASNKYSDASKKDVTHSFTPVTWDEGGRYVLIKHLYDNQTEWLVLDTQNADSTANITQVFNTAFKDVQFASTNGKVFYGLTADGTIRKVDVSAGTLSRAYVTHASSFSVYDNTIISYVGTDPANAAKGVVGLYRDGDEAAHILRSVSVDDQSQTPVLKIAVGRYFSDDYVAIAEGDVVTVLKGSYPRSSNQDNSSLTSLATFTLAGAASALSFSPESDYVLAQSGSSFVSYEIEHNITASGTVATQEGQAASTLRWLDDDHVWNDDNGSLLMRDFNGSNIFAIMAVEPGFDASLSQNGRFFYAVGKSDKGYHLQRITMLLD